MKGENDMLTQAVTVAAKTAENIIIGRRGTRGTEQISFDVSYLIDTFGDGTAVLMVKRPGGDAAYPATTERSENLVVWTVSDTDTSYKGHGECELFWYVDDALAKSVIYAVTILRDIGETTATPPDAYETWIDTLTALGAETLHNAEDAAQSAEDAAQSAADAADAKEDADAAAESAQGYANAAAGSANSASDYATAANRAKLDAEAARDKAETAQGKAEDAQEAAETAQGKAEDAQGLAEAAQVSASASAASAYRDANRAEQAANTAGFMEVEIVNGHLIYTKTDAVDVDFYLDDGHLIMEAV